MQTVGIDVCQRMLILPYWLRCVIKLSVIESDTSYFHGNLFF